MAASPTSRLVNPFISPHPLPYFNVWHSEFYEGCLPSPFSVPPNQFTQRLPNFRKTSYLRICWPFLTTSQTFQRQPVLRQVLPAQPAHGGTIRFRV